MTDSMKERISADLQRVKEEGGVRADRIRSIVRAAVSQAVVELKGGSSEIGGIVKDAVTTVIDTVGTKSDQAKEEITASIEGAIEGVSESKRESIAETQVQIDQLQSRINAEEQQLETEIDGALMEIERSSDSVSDNVKSFVDAAVAAIRDRELAPLQEQYARLKAQLAVLDAKLSARYGDRYGEVKQRFETAKDWYDTNKAKMEAGEINPVHQRQVEMEERLSEAGTTIAKKEQEIKQKVKAFLHKTADRL